MQKECDGENLNEEKYKFGLRDEPLNDLKIIKDQELYEPLNDLRTIKDQELYDRPEGVVYINSVQLFSLAEIIKSI